MATSAPETSLVDLLSSCYAPIRSRFLPHLSMSEIIVLEQTCKAFTKMWDTVKKTSLNIDVKLKKFFKDPKAFRTVQGRCNALIGGLFALKFFARAQDEQLPGQLDIYADEWDLHLLMSYLSAEGYMALESDDDQFNPGPMPPYNLTLTKQDSQGKTLKINVTAARSPIAELLKTSTTAFFNLIAWNRAYALFPHHTFIKQERYLTKPMVENLVPELVAVSENGIRTMSISWERQFYDEGTRDDKLTHLRRVGDKRTWVIDLCIDGVAIPETPIAVLESTTFRLFVPIRCNGRGTNTVVGLTSQYLTGVSHELCHPVLKRAYAHTSVSYSTRVGYCYSEKVDLLLRRLEDVSIIGLMKLPADKSPGNYENVLAQLRSDRRVRPRTIDRLKSELPKSWTYYDDLVIKYLEDAWAEEERQEQYVLTRAET